MFSQGERKVGVGEEDCRKWNRTILPTWRRGKRQLSCEWCWMFHTRHLGLVLIMKSKLGLLRSLYIYWSDGFYYKIIPPLWTGDIFWHVAHVWYMGMTIFFSFFILNIFLIGMIWWFQFLWDWIARLKWLFVSISILNDNKNENEKKEIHW